MAKKIELFDSTLRDGAQGEGVSFTVDDKLKIVELLDDLGFEYIEAGNPGSNPKDLNFFEKVSKLNLKKSKIVAFGSTRRRNISVDEDDNVKSLLKANTEAVAIFGKSSILHVTKVINATPQENLEMITDTVRFFTEKKKTVIYDAEHFYDGYKESDEYAMSTLKAAVDGGAVTLALCDTNGGCLPSEIDEITSRVVKTFPDVQVGIHCHNDSGLAVANSISAVEAGARQVQGTFLGIGERTGNANLSTIIPVLQLKAGYKCISDASLEKLTVTAEQMASITNLNLSSNSPFVGSSAFAHKGGMHIDGIGKLTKSFEHIEPELVGNRRRLLISEVAGRKAVLAQIDKFHPGLDKESDIAKNILAKLKEQEHQGYQYEAAPASFELMVRSVIGDYKPFFDVEYFKVQGERLSPDRERYNPSTAVVKIVAKKKSHINAGEGDGPVDALNIALRSALEPVYPQLKKVVLIDYKVRVIEGSKGTGSKVRVFINSSDGNTEWTTVAVSSDIINASFNALVESFNYLLLMEKE